VSDTPGWFEDDLEHDHRPRRRAVLVAAAAVVVALLVLVATTLAVGRTPPSGAAVEAGAHHAATGSEVAPGAEPHGEGSPGAGPADPGPTSASSDDGPAGAFSSAAEGPADARTAATVSRDEAEAVVTAVARAWLSDAGPDLSVPGVEVERHAYLEHLTIEGFDLPTPEFAVARVSLVLLHAEDDRYTEARLRRAAVPLTLTEGRILPAGQPWWVPGATDLAASLPPLEPVDDTALTAEAVEVLTAVGYEDVEVGDLAGTPTGTVRAQVRATTPEGEAIDGPVWLQTTAEGLLLLGAPPP
jgi:hypothetical protein